jgi:hypothetical protein
LQFLPYIVAVLSLLIPIFFLVYWLSKKLRALPPLSPKLRIVAFVALLILASIVPIRIFTGWAPAGPVFVAVGLYALSLIAYFVLIFAAWRIARRPNARWPASVLSFLLTIPLLFLVNPFWIFVAVLSMPGANLTSSRISPMLTYQISEQQALFSGTKFDSYEIYKQPVWFPVIQRKMANGPTNCPRKDISFSPGLDSNTVLMSCQNALPKEIKLH